MWNQWFIDLFTAVIYVSLNELHGVYDQILLQVQFFSWDIFGSASPTFWRRIEEIKIFCQANLFYTRRQQRFMPL